MTQYQVVCNVDYVIPKAEAESCIDIVRKAGDIVGTWINKDTATAHVKNNNERFRKWSKSDNTYSMCTCN